MKNQKNGRPGKHIQSSIIITILMMILIACIFALGILVIQYHQLTDDVIYLFRKAETEMSVSMDTEMETEMETTFASELKAETEAESKESEASSSDTEETIITQEQETEGRSRQTETEKLIEELQIDRQPEPAIEHQNQVQAETQPSTQPAQVVHTAQELTIADIPNSLYGKLKNPEKLRTSLFAWLDSQGASDYLYCTCDYEYTEDGQVIVFILRFQSFNVEVSYNIVGDTYSFSVM